jgi:hypothetical protein
MSSRKLHRDRQNALRALTPVNKRLSFLAHIERARVPHSIIKSSMGLSSDHFDIIYKLLQRQDVDILSLSGSAVFFSSVLDVGFKSLSWLQLRFGTPALLHVQGWVGHMTVCDEIQWIMRLRERVRAIPLKYLEMSFSEPHPYDMNEEYSLAAVGILLAAGHPTLSTFALEGEDEPNESDDYGNLAARQPCWSASTKIKSLQMRHVAVEHVRMLAEAFGQLPLLSELAIFQPYDEDFLNAFPSYVALSILHLRYDIGDHVGRRTFASLSNFRNLISLDIVSSEDYVRCKCNTLHDLRLPHLQVIKSLACDAFEVNTAIFQWAQEIDALPALQSIFVESGEGVSALLRGKLLTNMHIAFDGLVSSRPDVQIHPTNFRELTERRVFVAGIGDGSDELFDQVFEQAHAQMDEIDDLM